jgi:hypothetical protein
MQASVRPRYVAPPWERDLYAARRVRVDQEADVAPESGPVALYRSVWPERYVVWNVKRQLFEIRQRNPDTGADERVELVFAYDAPPNPDTGLLRSLEELEEMVRQGHPSLVRVYQPFDYEFVRRRLRERTEFLAAGLKHYSRRVTGRNRQTATTRRRSVAREQAARIGDALPAYNPGRGAAFTGA